MIERKIIIGLITSTEFCQKIKPLWDIQLLESATAKRIATWTWEYFDKYAKAPGREMETIYFTKIKDGKFPKDIAEEIEQDILPSLSDESVNEPINLEYLLEETNKYLQERHLQRLSDSVEALISAGQMTEAEDMIREFKPLGLSIQKLDDFIRSVEQIREKKQKKPILLMKPWLRGGQTTILYGHYGCGKSLLAIAVAYMLGLRDYEDVEIGQWIVANPTGTLYIDGELGEQEMDERIQSFEWLGKQKYKIRILSIPEYQLETEDSFYLSDRTNQRKIIQWLQDHKYYKLVVLDSASTLFGLENENDNSEWSNKINPFLRDLRALGVACLLLHHAGKDNKKGLRGASAMGAMAHNIFRLSDFQKDEDGGEAKFLLTKDKQRSVGKGFRTFALRFFQEEGNTSWQIIDT